jgi:hypothetical protein
VFSVPLDSLTFEKLFTDTFVLIEADGGFSGGEVADVGVKELEELNCRTSPCRLVVGLGLWALAGG